MIKNCIWKLFIKERCTNGETNAVNQVRGFDLCPQLLSLIMDNVTWLKQSCFGGYWNNSNFFGCMNGILKFHWVSTVMMMIFAKYSDGNYDSEVLSLLTLWIALMIKCVQPFTPHSSVNLSVLSLIPVMSKSFNSTAVNWWLMV